MEDGALTRSGNNYVGQITHFSVFNADTIGTGGACVRVLLTGFTLPVTFNATYFNTSVGSFNHPNTVDQFDFTVGVERMIPNQPFTLTVTDFSGSVVAAASTQGPASIPCSSHRALIPTP